MTSCSIAAAILFLDQFAQDRQKAGQQIIEPA
jgi:hypothetical protein